MPTPVPEYLDHLLEQVRDDDSGQLADYIDELAAATSAGLISAEEAERAMERTLTAVEGITRYGDDAMAWLRTLGIELSWAESVSLTPAE